MLAMRRYFLITMRKVENFVKAVLGLMYHLTCKPFIKHIAGHPIDDIYPFGAFSNVLIGEGELEAFLTMYCTLSAITIFRVYKWD